MVVSSDKGIHVINKMDTMIEIRTMDDALPLIGSFHRFQWLLDVIVLLVNFSMSYQNVIMYFLTLTPTWQCEQGSKTCLWNGTHQGNDHRRCNLSRTEWQYTERVEYSLVTTFDLHCKDEWLVHLLMSIFFIGYAFGAIIIGWAADNYGRKTVFFPSVAVVLVIGFLSSFSPYLVLIIVSQFLIGFFVAGTMAQGFVLLLEVIDNHHRPFGGIFIFVSASFAWAFIALKAYLLKNWKQLCMVSTAPYFLVIFFARLVLFSLNVTYNQSRVTILRISRANQQLKTVSNFPTEVFDEKH